MTNLPARRKKHSGNHLKQGTAPRRRRSHRVNGIGSIGGIDMLSGFLYPAIGGTVGTFADKIIPASWDGKIKAGAKIAVGFLLPMIAGKNAKTKMVMAGIGGGLIAVGTADLIKGLGLISGIGFDEDEQLAVALEGLDDDDDDEMNGFSDYQDVIADSDMSVLNGSDDMSVLNGGDDSGKD